MREVIGPLCHGPVLAGASLQFWTLGYGNKRLSWASDFNLPLPWTFLSLLLHLVMKGVFCTKAPGQEGGEFNYGWSPSAGTGLALEEGGMQCRFLVICSEGVSFSKDHMMCLPAGSPSSHPLPQLQLPFLYWHLPSDYIYLQPVATGEKNVIRKLVRNCTSILKGRQWNTFFLSGPCE